ncbi:hypothetical protein MaudMau93_005216 [Microsporum audouinii]
MTDTPRLRSAFPRTPRSNPRTPRTSGGYRDQNVTPTPFGRGSKINFNTASAVVRSANAAQPQNPPLIPFHIVDAPAQRLYVVAFYVALNSWRLYEYWTSTDEGDATWLFLKWLLIDAVYLFGLPILRIPWLEWAFSTTLAIFLVHVVINVFLMFRIPLPMEAWGVALFKMAYDRELSISGQRVKPYDILHNSSLILGKHIVHILPEGSAVLNPDKVPLCLGHAHTSVNLPIRVNQTNPILIEILRFDLDTGANETIVIPEKQAKALRRQASQASRPDSQSWLDLLYPVRKTGVYQIKRVVDESRLAVHHRSMDTLVVTCPKASVQTRGAHKCRGELSDLTMSLHGTPPFKIKYSRTVNDVDQGISFQSIQPETHHRLSESDEEPINPTLAKFNWARPQKVEVPLNESLSAFGEWVYAIEEVHDGCGNVVNYTLHPDVDDSLWSQHPPHSQKFFVHELPRVSLAGCDTQTYLQIAKGESIDLPVHFHDTGYGQNKDFPFTLSYSFAESGDDSDKRMPTSAHEFEFKNSNNRPRIKASGWYRITGISSQFCRGEVFEPSSCYLHNPAEPQLAIRHEKVYDSCANNSVGLLVYLDLIGTPPFRVRYSIEHSKGVQTRVHTINGLHGQLDLKPAEEGHYKYRFLDISDRVYETRSLKDSVPALEQDVKPPASAHFVGPLTSRKACFGEPVSMDVMFVGEPPWVLNYEVVHNGKRKKHELKSDTDVASLSTVDLVNGGVYTVGLTSVKDRSNCKRALKEEIRIEARPKRPRVAFGQIDQKRNVLALEGKAVDLPLRLEGEAPWKVKYRNKLDPSAAPVEKTFWNANSVLRVSDEGQYEIIGLSDATCPGSVDEKAHIFDVSWISRPKITEIDSVKLGTQTTFAKDEVCEGDVSSLELKFGGNRPYTVRYEESYKAGNSNPSARMRSLTAALNSASIPMRTSVAGNYTYKFLEIGDNLYSPEKKAKDPIVVTQRVNPRPSARFESPSKVYGFCKEEEQEDETIPILLEGVPPFTLELAVKHHSNAKPELLSIPNINSNRYALPVPRQYLDLGQHVISIRKVRDSRGCQRATEFDGSSIRVSISDVPTILPLESREDYCVGERISFSLSGHSPFEIYYTFDGVARKAKSQATTFRRIAEMPGEFKITSVSDGASGRCRVHKNITKVIHQMPSVRISRGGVSVVDIPEGGEAEIMFEFWGTPPFEFTYTRSTNDGKGKKRVVLDTKNDISHEHTKTIKASDEGTYEVVAIKDRYCSFSTQNTDKGSRRGFF